MTAMRNLLAQRFGRLLVERDMDGDGMVFICRCDCGNSRKMNRQRLINGGESCACESCAWTAKHTSKRPVAPKPVEPLARIELPCLGCTVRIIGGKRYLAIQPDCLRHSSFYGGAGSAFPRSPLTVGQGRAIHSHRKAGMSTE